MHHGNVQITPVGVNGVLHRHAVTCARPAAKKKGGARGRRLKDPLADEVRRYSGHLRARLPEGVLLVDQAKRILGKVVVDHLRPAAETVDALLRTDCHATVEGSARVLARSLAGKGCQRHQGDPQNVQSLHCVDLAPYRPTPPCGTVREVKTAIAPTGATDIWFPPATVRSRPSPKQELRQHSYRGLKILLAPLQC